MSQESAFKDGHLSETRARHETDLRLALHEFARTTVINVVVSYWGDIHPAILISILLVVFGALNLWNVKVRRTPFISFALSSFPDFSFLLSAVVRRGRVLDRYWKRWVEPRITSCSWRSPWSDETFSLRRWWSPRPPATLTSLITSLHLANSHPGLLARLFHSRHDVRRKPDQGDSYSFDRVRVSFSPSDSSSYRLAGQVRIPILERSFADGWIYSWEEVRGFLELCCVRRGEFRRVSSSSRSFLLVLERTFKTETLVFYVAVRYRWTRLHLSDVWRGQVSSKGSAQSLQVDHLPSPLFLRAWSLLRRDYLRLGRSRSSHRFEGWRRRSC